MQNAKRLQLLRDAWALARPYWFSRERWLARGLLVAVIGLNLGSVYIDVRINQWNNAFYNALQALDSTEFFRQIGIFSILAGIDIVISVYALYLRQMLQIRWRRWMTEQYLSGWLANRTYYRLQLTGDPTDNPDQRISEDLNFFTSQTLGLSLGFLSAMVSLVSFLFILWGLSGPLALSLGSLGVVHIPAYLVWAALLYATVGTWLTVKIGRPLVRLNFDQQRYEADFRFSLVRLRENAESVAFYGGENREHHTFQDRFQWVLGNFWQIMRRRKALNWFTSGYNQIAIIFPYVVAAPRYFSKEIQLGALMQVADAFSSVQTSLSFIINSYAEIATWQAIIERLTGFSARMAEIAQASEAPQPIAIDRRDKGLSVNDLDLDLPNGEPLRRGLAFDLPTHGSLMIEGRSGAGKSTLLRAIAGLWPFGRGQVRLGGGRSLFLPQRPYVPLGSLRNALLYPDEGMGSDAGRLAAVLEKVGLGHLAPHLEEIDNWAQRLSIGEQQRLAFARIFLNEPDTVFLDEATSGLDEAGEAELYRLLRTAPWHPTIVSVGHRSTLRSFHDRTIDLAGSAAGQAAE